MKHKRYRFEGMNSRDSMLRTKYRGYERVRICGGEARKLSPEEIRKWHEQMEKIMEPSPPKRVFL